MKYNRDMQLYAKEKRNEKRLAVAFTELAEAFRTALEKMRGNEHEIWQSAGTSNSNENKLEMSTLWHEK